MNDKYIKESSIQYLRPFNPNSHHVISTGGILGPKFCCASIGESLITSRKQVTNYQLITHECKLCTAPSRWADVVRFSNLIFPSYIMDLRSCTNIIIHMYNCDCLKEFSNSRSKQCKDQCSTRPILFFVFENCWHYETLTIRSCKILEILIL